MSDTPDSPNTVPASEMIDRLCDEFEQGWLDHCPAPLEDVVRIAPEATRAPLFRELLAVERAYRARDGRPLTAAEARERFGGLGSWTDGAIQELLGATGSWAERPTPPRGHFSDALGPSPAALPEFAGGYRVVRELGRGGMGVVYLVDDPLGRRQLAVKMMLSEKAIDPTIRDRFLREARSASAVVDDNVVAIYEVKEEQGTRTPYLVMPFLQGETLEDRLKRDPRPALPVVFKVGREIALGLAAAHDKGLVHRDVKPANTWLEGNPAVASSAQVKRVKVLDFGLARAADNSDGVSLSGLVVGTPAYMAPEQARGERVDARADLFSLGAILYRMAAGRPAFDGTTVTAILTKIATHNPPPVAEVNPAIPAELSSLIMQLLEKEASKRPGSAREVADAVTAIEKGQSVPARTSSKRLRLLLAGGVLLLLACVAAVILPSPFKGPESSNEARGNPKTPAPAPGLNAKHNTPSVPVSEEQFRVKSVDVLHHAHTPQGHEPRGIIGRKSFTPALGDRVEIVARLSRPGYAYILAFRPDGVTELCFPDGPDKENMIPPRTDAPRYPATAIKKGEKTVAYGLDEGTGLWVFAVVASEKPLPSYRQWLASRKSEWKPEAASPGSVWWYDGAALETWFEGGNTRGSGAELKGPATKVRALGQWLEQDPGATIGVIGFGVGEGN